MTNKLTQTQPKPDIPDILRCCAAEARPLVKAAVIGSHIGSEMGFGKVGFGEIRIGKVGFGKVGFGEVGFGEVGFGKVGFGEVGFGKVGFGEVGFGEVGFGEVGFGKVGGHPIDMLQPIIVVGVNPMLGVTMLVKV